MDQSSSSEFTISKRESKVRKNMIKDESQKQGRWSSEQNLRYLVFLQYNMSKFECKKKRMFRLYKPLSKFILTRTSEQCRSHHRKLLQRFKTPKNIVLSLEHQFDREQIEQFKQVQKELLKELPIPQKKMRTNEKQEQFSQKSEQKNGYKNQIRRNQVAQLNQKSSGVLEVSNSLSQGSYISENLKPMGEMSTLNYQALNWFHQMYIANFNYYLEQTGIPFYNGFNCASFNVKNS